MTITITVNGASTLDETDLLQHALSGTDADNDVAVGTLPAAFSTRLTALGLSLDPTSYPGRIGVAESPAELIDIASTAAVSTLGFTDAAGLALNGDDSGIDTTDNQNVYLWTDPTNDNILLGTTSSTVPPGQAGAGDVVFAVYMQESADTDGTTDIKLWHVAFEPLKHPDPAAADEAIDLLQNAYVSATGPLRFDFDELPSGANLFGVVGESPNDSAIIVIGRDPVVDSKGKYTNASDVIHTSQGGTGATIGVNNQMFDGTDNDGAYFTYVNQPVANFLSGYKPGGLTATEADNAGNIQYQGGLLNVGGASFTVSQGQGNALATARITAYSLSDDYQQAAFASHLGAAGGSQATIDAVRVLNASGTVVEAATLSSGVDPNFNDPGITITFSGGSAEVSGLPANYTVEWETEGLHNQALVEAVVGKFDIGAFSVTQGDLETASLAGHVYVEDDAPSLGPIAGSDVDYVAGSTGPVTLLGDTNQDVAGTYAITDFTASVVVGGVTLIGAKPAGSDTSVQYFEDKDASSTFTAGDVLYYTLALSSTTDPGAYTFTVNNAPAAPSLEFNFSAMPSGQSLFGMVGNENDALLFFGKTPVLKGNGEYSNTSNTINTSQGGGPTTIGVDNQMFDADKQDGAYFTYVKDPRTSFLAGATGGLDQNEADDADNMLYDGGLLDADSAFFKVSQLQGNTTATATITAYALDDDYQGKALIDSRGGDGDDKVNLDGVTVYAADGVTVIEQSGSDLDPTVGVSIVNGVATVSGLQAGYKVEWHTVADHNQVLIEAAGGKFDIGAFGISTPQDTNDHKLDFEVTLTDADLDAAVSTFSIRLDGNHDGFFV